MPTQSRKKASRSAKAKAPAAPKAPSPSTSIAEFHNQFSTCKAFVAVAQHALLTSTSNPADDADLASYAETVLHETRRRMEAMSGWLDLLETHYQGVAGGVK